jgi:hypothetical protein
MEHGGHNVLLQTLKPVIHDEQRHHVEQRTCAAKACC